MSLENNNNLVTILVSHSLWSFIHITHTNVWRKLFSHLNFTDSQDLTWNFPRHVIYILLTWFIYLTINHFVLLINHNILGEHLQIWKISSSIGLLDHIYCYQKFQWIDAWLIVQQMISVPCSTEGHDVGGYPIFWYSLVGSTPIEPSS